jgi:hypothetical protein
MKVGQRKGLAKNRFEKITHGTKKKKRNFW